MNNQLIPCRSPYCECDIGKCTHPNCFDARHIEMNRVFLKMALDTINFRLDPDSNHLEAQICPEDLQEFAELLIRECIDTVSDCSVEYCTRPQIVNEIKEHFGVEE